MRRVVYAALLALASCGPQAKVPSFTDGTETPVLADGTSVTVQVARDQVLASAPQGETGYTTVVGRGPHADGTFESVYVWDANNEAVLDETIASRARARLEEARVAAMKKGWILYR